MALDDLTAVALQHYLLADLPVLRCVAPLLTKLDDPSFPPEATLSLRASCCVLRMSNVLVALTANHVLRPREGGLVVQLGRRDVVVLHALEGVRIDLPIRAIMASANENDPDVGAVFLDRGSACDGITIVPFDNHNDTGLLEPDAEPGDVFIALGYPNDLASIEYGDREGAQHRIRYQAQRLAGHYVGPSGRNQRGMHQIRFVDPSAVVRPGGMSGGGVFRLIIDPDPAALWPFRIAFSGIISSASQEALHFVDLRRVFNRVSGYLDSL